MEFATIARLAALLAKPYAAELLRLLVLYRDISASESASRLNLHIKTTQDFLEELAALDIATRREVSEGKRPYYRYTLTRRRVVPDIDFETLVAAGNGRLPASARIRERKDGGALFTTASGNDRLSSVSVFEGEGRKRKERRISLSEAQGRFLFHLPFPTAAFETVEAILDRAGLDSGRLGEVVDIVDFLVTQGVIEVDSEADA